MTIHHEHNYTIEGVRQPGSQMCFVCGVANVVGLNIRFYCTGHHEVEAVVNLPKQYQGYPGIAHGGIIATVLDETMGRAAISPENPNRLLVTGKMEVRYRHSVPLNIPIRVRGWIIKDRGRVIVARGEAVLPDGTVAVETEGTMMAIPDETLDDMNTPDVGWRVYEDHEYPD